MTPGEANVAQPVPLSLQRGICGAGWEEGWDGSQSPCPRDLSGISTLVCAQWIRAPELPLCPAPQSSCEWAPSQPFPGMPGLMRDVGVSLHPPVPAVTSPTEPLHEQDALHHHSSGQAGSSAACSHRRSSKPSPPAAQDSLSLVLLLSKVTSKTSFPH